MKVLFLAMAPLSFAIAECNDTQFQDAHLVFGFEAVTMNRENSIQHYLSEATTYRNFANEYLRYAEGQIDIIPDFNTKDQIKIFIASFISSLPIPDPRQKLLVVGLALIGDLVNQYGIGTYENYLSLSNHLNDAADYLERSNVYNRLAMGSPLFTKKFSDNLAKYGTSIEHLIHMLITAEMISTTIESKAENIAISDSIFRIREAIISEFEVNGTIVEKHSDEIEHLRENFPEIFAECHPSDRHLSEYFDNILYCAQGRLEDIEEDFGLK